MAVVQISKIQVRRGQKNSNSGVPQLSSAEFAWAIDTQELFIGNGSVAEGAPYVGNTKVLTEHDNILDLASSYRFANNDTAISLSVSRSLQSKEDETVSVADFGAVGDGSTDCSAAFSTAFTELFRNANTNYRKELLIPNGEYLFTSELVVPSHVILKGETQTGAILNIGNNNVRFVTSTGLSFLDFNSTNRPQNIIFSNFTIRRTTGQVIMSGIANSIFDSVKFIGEYQLGDTITLSTESAAVVWQNTLAGTKVDNLKFRKCEFQETGIAVKCIQTDTFDTAIRFEDCKFFVNDTSIYIDGVTSQGNKWQINDCEFEEIANQGFRSNAGRGTLIQRSKFKNVGNSTNTNTNPNDYMVYFGEKIGNTVLDCSSDRQQAAAVAVSGSTPAFTEVYNSSGVNFVDKNFSLIYLSDSFTPLAIFSAQNKFTQINYCLKLGEHTRYGQLTITIGDDLSALSHGSEVSLTDNFAYSPNYITSPGGNLMTNFEFNISKSSNTVLDDSTAAVVDTLILTYKNPLATGATGSISFDVAYGV
jgi:hypothetical protein